MKGRSVFYDKTLSAQGSSVVWAKNCDVKEDKSELGERSFDKYFKSNTVYLNIFQGETRIPKAPLYVCFAALLEKQIL